MESVAKLCEECTHYVSGDCEGKAQSEVRKGGKTPCGKYQLYAGEDLDTEQDVKDEEQFTKELARDSAKDYEQLDAVLEPETVETESVQPEPANVKPETTSESTRQRSGRIAGGAKSLEQRQADFQRILAKRLPKAIAAISSIGNLSNRYAYSWTSEQVRQISETLLAAVDETVIKFQA